MVYITENATFIKLVVPTILSKSPFTFGSGGLLKRETLCYTFLYLAQGPKPNVQECVISHPLLNMLVTQQPIKTMHIISKLDSAAQSQGHEECEDLLSSSPLAGETPGTK